MIPTRIIEPNAPDVAGPPPPTPAHVCPECTLAGDEALAKSTERTEKVSHKDLRSAHTKSQRAEPTPES